VTVPPPLRPSRCKKVSEHELAGGTILYSAAADRVASLNPTAARIWSMCDGDRTLEDLCGAFCRETAWPEPAARSEVRRVVERLVREGFLRDGPGTIDCLRVGFAGNGLDLEIDCPATSAALASRFRQLLQPADGALAFDRLEIVGRELAHYLACGSWSENHAGPFAERLRAIEARIVERIVHSHPELVWLHAGVAAGPAGGVLVTGASGCGKSSITVALMRARWRFGGDDLVAVRPDGRVEPFPLTPVVRQPIEAQLPEGRLHELTRSEAGVAETAAGTIPIAVVAFPTYRFGATEGAQPLSPAEALMLLVRQCTTFRRQRGFALQALIALLEQARAVRLVYGSASRAAELVARLCVEATETVPLAVPASSLP
jgi:hypothetical protein